MKNLEIKGFAPNSLVDWDGKVSAVIFLAGCNFRCKFCSNKDLVLESEKINPIPFENIIKYLEKNKDFIDGVVITGGEPCMHKGLTNLCRIIKEIGFKVKIDTNGSYPGMLQELLDKRLVDFIAMDIKTCFEKYKSVVNTNTEVDLEKIKKSIEIVTKFPDYEFRTTLFPEITKQDLLEVARYLKEKNANRAFFIQQFRPDECLDEEAEKIKPYTKAELECFGEDIKGYFEKFGIRNA
jgi:pyruvate formate lyase activating enzyme